MNAISKRPEPHDDDKVGSVIIPADELARIYEEQKQERARIKRRERFKSWTNGSVMAGQTLVILGLVGVIIYMLPLQKIIPIPVNVRDDGTTATVARWNDLPEAVRANVTINTVWTYVQQRESWSAANAGHAWDVVSALSSQKVRENVQNWYRADNPESPAQVNKDMTVHVSFVRWEPICPIEKACINDGPPAYRVWFDRVETTPDGKKTPPARYAATVGINRDIEIPQNRIWQLWTINPAQIQVTEYPGAQREGISK